ncbi:MAG: hypothetical protein KDD51_15490 [Bdellovibrionales bacterium]|nr:hypothetical protein [Bdellovibrionales bacterium]
MKRVSELYGRYTGETIYVVGSGASLRIFPVEFLRDKITIGLNMAWKWAPVRYGITIHPDLNVPEFLPEQKRPLSLDPITWVTGYEKCRGGLDPKQLQYAEENFYFFSYHGKPNTQPPEEPSDSGRVLDWVERPSGDNLYVWSSIAQAGVNLAANMGAREIFLVGCDNGPLSNNHHAGEQHTRWKGVSPEHRYRQYREGLQEIRDVLEKRGVTVLSLTPFLGLSSVEQEFEAACLRKGLPPLVKSYDISPKRGVAGLWARISSRIGGAVGTH